MIKITRSIFLIIVFSSIFTSYAQSNLKEIKLALHWLPQAQFAGYYIGVEKGIYEKYGFDVKLYHSSPSITAQEYLLDQKVDFATMFLTTAMLLKSNNVPIVNVGQLSQKCGQVLVAKSANIKELKDLDGKKVGIWRSGFEEILTVFAEENNLNLDLVLINSTINLFLFDAIEAMATMWFNEYHTILNAGINEDELTTFFFSDYGLDIPEDGIYMLENKFDDETVKRFVQATLESWDYAFNNKDEAVKLVEKKMKDNNIAFNKPHQMWMLNRIQDLFSLSGKDCKKGELLRTDFDNAYRVLSSSNKIRNAFRYQDFYKGIR